MAVLRTLTGSSRGETVVLGDRAIIGRHPGCHIVLRHAAVSRHHAQIQRRQNAWFIEDLASQNGTWLNGKRVVKPTPIADGDIIQICGFEFQFYQEADSAAGNTPSSPVVDFDGARDLGRTDEFDARALPPRPEHIDPPTPPAPGLEAEEAAAQPAAAPCDNAKVLASIRIQPDSVQSFGDRPVAELDRMLRLMQLLSAATSREQLIERILDDLADAIPAADEMAVLLCDAHEGLSLVGRRDHQQWRVPARPLFRMAQAAVANCEATLTVAEDSRPPAVATGEAGERLRTTLTVPLVVPGQPPLGVVQLVACGAERRLNTDHLRLAVSLVLPAALALHCALKYEDRLRQQLFEREVVHLRSLRRAFASPPPRVPGYDLASQTRYVAGRSSDFTVFLLSGDPAERLLVVLGDTSCEGVAGGILGASLAALLREAFLRGHDVAELARVANERLSADVPHRQMVSAFLGVLDLQRHVMRYVNCGGMPPVLSKAQTRDTRVLGEQAANVALGLVRDAAFTVEEFQLDAGDACVLCSDGLANVRNSQGQMFGMHSIAAVVASGGEQAAGALCDRLVQEALRFGGFVLGDDASVVALRRC